MQNFTFGTPDFQKLYAFGFRKEGEGAVYERDIVGGQLRLRVTVVGERTEVFLLDAETGDPYTLYLVSDAVGEFVGAVRREVNAVLADVGKCFERSVFSGSQTKELIAALRARYGDEPEYLWEKFPENAVFRRRETRKWYAAILTAPPKYFGMEGEKTEIVDLHASAEEVPALVDGKTVFAGWHMNKKHWISVPLDGRMPFGELLALVEKSYVLAK